MPLNLTGQPLIDRADFPELLASGHFGRWSKEASALHDHGYCVLNLATPSFLDGLEDVIRSLEPLLAEPLSLWEQGEGSPPRLQDGWLQHASIRGLALEPVVLDLLSTVYGREPFAFQTLNFAVGSEQPYHSDAIHFHSYPLGFMCGVWIALRDVENESGPLIYYPGSHRLPYLSAQSLGLDPVQVAAEPHPQRFFQDHWHAAVQSGGFPLTRFLAKRGEVLIWHANLLHGGEPVQSRSCRRWSQVIHYFFSDCLYTTPLCSFGAADGGPFLRNPFDIETGHPRYTKQEWANLGLSAPQRSPLASSPSA
ncbi:MAG: phytanoyl-CoA dioxygenase family protein [Cyanobacteria bacterium K_Offshore_surface_m2_239]|nr:phytanoyl-CoA dioxygenase family protein [Cyanobacteria bacterium K_Offshore_surface_m2_239]